MRLKGILAGLLIICFGFGCDQTTEVKKPGSVEGMVRSSRNGNTEIFPAYIFNGDSLMAQTDESGYYRIPSLPPGSLQLTCSALFYSNSVQTIEVQEEQTATLNFELESDSTMGRVYGEFQDKTLWLEHEEELKNWTEKEIFDGGTYATLQTKWLGYEVPDRMVHLGDLLVAYADGFGQYWTRIQCGTYPLTGSCEGYESVTHTVTISPDEPVYLNFILPRSAVGTTAQRK